MATSFNLPANPTVGQEETLSNGVRVVWNGTGWIADATADEDILARLLPVGGTANQLLRKLSSGYEWFTQVITKATVGLSNVDDTSDLAKPVSDATQSALDLKVPTSALGVSVATLESGKVPSSQLPAYVDDIVEYANLAAFPATGARGIIYVALDTNRQYRWTDTVYVQMVSSPGTTDDVTEGTTNLYFTAARVLSSVIAGLSTATSTVITAADTVLVALGKLQAQITLRATLASPTFTGTPQAPTAAVNTSTDQIATTGFVQGRHAFTGVQSVNNSVLTNSGGTIAFDASLSNHFTLSLTANGTLQNPTNAIAGTSYVVSIIQSTGNTSLSFGSNYRFPGGVIPTVSQGVGQRDLLCMYYDGTVFYCTYGKAF